HEPGECLGRGGFVEIARVVAADIGTQSFGRVVEALPEERVGGDVPTDQLCRVHVPTLVETTFQGPPHEPRTQLPRCADLRGLPDRHPVAGPIGEEHSGSGRGDLHQGLRLVRGGVFHALVLRGDVAGRRVVVGAVVQSAAPARRGVNHRCAHATPGRIDYRLWRLHLDLEPQLPRR